MKTYRKNAVMAGALYFLGTVFGVVGGVIGGEVLASIISGQPLTGGAFFVILMGISLAAMTVFLYPIFRKDSEELAMGMLLFRGALEGVTYFVSTLSILGLLAFGNEYVATGANSSALRSMGNILYQFQDSKAPVDSLLFLIGATCLYLSFYRTRLIPRWLTVWGFIGVAFSMAYALLHFFHQDNGIGFYLQMVLAPQEIVMGIWLIIKGFNQAALKKLLNRPALGINVQPSIM